MKGRTPSTWGIFSCVFILVLAAMPSCKKHAKLSDDNDETVHSVKFKIKDFETIVSPLKTQSTKSKKASTTGGNSENQLLYHWNFDNSSGLPIVALEDGVLIDYDNGQTDYDFVGGWPTSGKAISFKGAKEVVIKIPTEAVSSFEHLDFDANSSGTGPRALFLSYSMDRGAHFTPLSDTLRYPAGLAISSKFAVSSSLTSIPLVNGGELWLRIALFPGNRDGGSNFNPTTGTFKMDNLMITGKTDPSVIPSKYYYHVFDAASKALIKSGTLNAKETFAVSLPNGTYYLSLIAKNSTLPLIVPEAANLADFYVANAFSERFAELFAGRDTFEVKTSVERVLSLNRIYSEIKLEFTDTEDLSTVDSIQIRQLHPTFHYYPFTWYNNEQLDKTLLSIVPNFTAGNQSLIFNQFMGDYLENKAIKYELNVFRKGEMLRTFELGAEVRNNVQVLFKGKLLDGLNGNQGFQVVKNEKWRDNVVIEY